MLTVNCVEDITRESPIEDIHLSGGEYDSSSGNEYDSSSGGEYDSSSDDNDAADVESIKITPVRQDCGLLNAFLCALTAILFIYCTFFCIHIIYVCPFEMRDVNHTNINEKPHFSYENNTIDLAFDFMNEAEFVFDDAYLLSTKNILLNFYKWYKPHVCSSKICQRILRKFCNKLWSHCSM